MDFLILLTLFSSHYITMDQIKPSDLRVGTIGWFLFPESYWSPGKIVDYDAFRAALLGAENASHDLIPKPPGFEAADTLVIFYPKSALSGWWTTRETICETQAFQELEDVAIESVTDALDAASSELVKMAYREASDERGEHQAIPKAPKQKKEPQPTRKEAKAKNSVKKQSSTPVPKASQSARKASTEKIAAKSEVTEKPQPAKKSASQVLHTYLSERRAKGLPTGLTPEKSQTAVATQAEKPKAKAFMLSDDSDEDEDIPMPKPPVKPAKALQPASQKAKRPARTVETKCSASSEDNSSAESQADDSDESSSGDDLFLSEGERERLFATNYTREKKCKRSAARSQASQLPRIPMPKPKRQYFTNEMDWYISRQADVEVQDALRRLQVAHRDIVRKEKDGELNYVRISELDFLKDARDALVAVPEDRLDRSEALVRVEAECMSKVNNVLGQLPSRALKERARRAQWVLPEVSVAAPEPADPRVAAMQSIVCRDIYKDDSASEAETTELFSSYNAYVQRVRSGL